MRGSPARPGSPSQVNVLLVSPSDSDRLVLSGLLAGTPWRVLHAHTCGEAAAILSSTIVPVIIRDHDCCQLGCEHAVRCSLAGPYPAPLVIAAESPDYRLWEDVIDGGGFEVIAKPFRAEAVTKVLEFAWKHWQAGVIRRSWDHFEFPD